MTPNRDTGSARRFADMLVPHESDMEDLSR
jgi:hypothetical protein